MNESKDYYDEIAHKYDYMYEEPYWFLYHEILKKLTVDHISENNKRILDVGTGTGRWAIYFAEKSNDVTAIDNSNQMLKIAKMKTDLRNLKIDFLEMSAENMPFNNNDFDYIVAYGDVLSYCNNIDLALNEIKRVLKKKGKLLFTVDNSYAFLKDFISNVEGYNAKKLLEGEKIKIGDKSVSINKFFTKPFFPDEISNLLHEKGFIVEDIACLVNLGLYEEDRLSRGIDLAADWEYKYCRNRELFSSGEHLFITAVLGE